MPTVPDEISLPMVFAFIVFTSLLIVTICLIASDPGPTSTAASAVWEVFAGNCRLNCRRNRTEVKGPLIQNLPSIIPATGQTSHTFKQAVELTQEYINLHSPEHVPETANAVQVSSDETKTTASPSTPNPTMEVVGPNSQILSENVCVCETCVCALIENLFSQTKPAENVYNDFKDAVLNSQFLLALGNMYARLASSYPNTLEYLEEDKIDSEENFYFLKTTEGQSHKASAVSKHVDINKRPSIKGSPQSINPLATTSASKFQNLLTHPTPSSHSKTPSSGNLPPAPKPILHHEKVEETPASVGLTIRDEPPTRREEPTLQESTDFVSERKPQSIASIEREIKEFISNGPPERPPLYTCPSCKSKGLVCVRGCPKEGLVKKTDESKQQ